MNSTKTKQIVKNNRSSNDYSITRKDLTFPAYLTNKAFVIIKKWVNEKELQEHRDFLKVMPKVNPNYIFGSIKSFPVYRENDNKLYLPKYYGISVYGIPPDVRMPKSIKINNNVIFNGELREKQMKPVEKTLETFSKGFGGGLLHLATGSGKTVVALYLITVLKVKTLIIVHKEFLLNQWRDRIKQFVPDATIGHIQQNKTVSDGCDIVLGMLQSIAFKDDYSDSLFRGFGMIIIDEVHHISAEYYSRALFKCSAPYTLGLSATPDRSDGLQKVFEWHSGPVIYSGKMKIRGQRPIVHMYYYTLTESKFCKELLNFRQKPNITTMITNVTLDPMRNKFIINRIKLIASKEKDRHILLLTERRNHIDYLKKTLDEDPEFKGTCGIYMGQVKQKVLDESTKATVILGTISMVKEGFDVPSLDTLILATSKGDIDQMVGRILRKEHKDRPPMIVDIADTFSSFGRQAMKRKAFYRKRKYKILVYDMIDNEEVNRYTDDYLKEDKIEENQPKITDFVFKDDDE